MDREATARELATDPILESMLPARMARNTGSNLAGRLIPMIGSFLVTPFVLAVLGPSDYGLWVLLGAVAGYGWLLDFGIGSAVTKFVAEQAARGQEQAVRRTVASALWLYAGLGLATCLLGAVMAPLAGDVFHVAPDQRPAVVWLTFLMALSVAIGLAFSPTTAVLRGLQRFGLSNLLAGGGALAALAANVAVLAAGGGLGALVTTNVIVTLASQLVALWICRRVAPELGIGWHRPDPAVARHLLAFSAPVFVVQLAGRLQFQTDGLVIGAFLAIGSLTPYSLAQRLAGLATVPAQAFSGVLLPVASELSALDDGRVGLRALYLFATRVTLASLMAAGIVLLMLAGPILRLWVGASYAGATDLVAILTIATIVDTSLWPTGYILQGMARHRPVAAIALGSGLANLILSMLLVQTIGLRGVALGTLVPTGIEAAAFVIPLAVRELRIQAGDLVREVLVPGLAPAALSALLLAFLDRSFDLASLPALIAAGGLALAVYALAYFGLDATRIERRLCLDAARHVAAWLHS